MTLTFSTLGCPEWSLDEILAFAKAQGIPALELRGIGPHVRMADIPELQPDQVSATKEKLQAAGVGFFCIGSSAMFHDGEKLQEAMAEGREAIRVAANFGAPYVRVFGNNIPADRPEAETVAQVAQGIQTLCDDAAPKGVSILLEVHGDFNTAQRILAVEAQVNRPNFGIIWDVAHSDQGYRENYAEFYRAVKPLVRHIHLKDHHRLPDGKTELCLPGQGDIPLKGIVELLQANGYDGFLSLEWEKRWHPALPSMADAYAALKEVLG